jgi:tRNA A-37 threonylcarbamoyl transferase component Bud32
MSPTEWNRVSDLFASAADLDTAQRSRLLEREDEPVRSEVERLLKEHQSSGLLDRPVITGAEASEAEEKHWCGKILNARYRIARFLARGGAGAVYVAYDEQLAGRAVVVKFLQSSARQDQWLKSNFRKEMEALARIDHHGVVGILDAGETADGLPFLVIEYIDGATLRSEIQKGLMEGTRVAQLIRQIGRAVSAAHDKGVLHRDLKPENIMLEHAGTPSETVRLIDFGIASVDRPDQETLTHTTRFAGTTPYMAPEQLAGRPRRSSDIYAMGVLAYEMLTGRRPFVAGSPVELYEQQRAGVKSELRRMRPEIPAPAMRTILRQLSFKPEDRSGSALEAGEQIAAALEGKLRDEPSRRLVAGALVGGAGLAATGAYFWSRRAVRPLAPTDRVIELPMGTEPLEQGFHKTLDIDYHVLPNADATGFDSMRMFSTDQGGYWHSFSSAQQRAAQRIGWKMTIEAAVDEGCLYAQVDNPLVACRYAVALVRNPDHTDCAQCLLSVAPVIRGIDRVLPGPAGRRHQFVLTWTPSTEGTLWVDGVQWIAGYKGEPNFRYARGFEFGAGRRRSQRAGGVFWKIRLDLG